MQSVGIFNLKFLKMSGFCDIPQLSLTYNTYQGKILFISGNELHVFILDWVITPWMASCHARGISCLGKE